MARLVALLALGGCAPSLRPVDAEALRYVRDDMAVRSIASPPGADRILFRTNYCVLDAVLRASSKGDPDNVAQPLKCR